MFSGNKRWLLSFTPSPCPVEPEILYVMINEPLHFTEPQPSFHSVALELQYILHSIKRIAFNISVVAWITYWINDIDTEVWYGINSCTIKRITNYLLCITASPCVCFFQQSFQLQDPILEANSRNRNLYWTYMILYVPFLNKTGSFGCSLKSVRGNWSTLYFMFSNILHFELFPVSVFLLPLVLEEV